MLTPNWTDKDNLKGLLVRLEAAENNINDAWNLEDIIEVPESFGDSAKAIMQKAINNFRVSHEAWRKACGK